MFYSLNFYLGSSRAIRESLRVTLVEAGDLAKVRDWDPQPGSFSNRVSSLTNASQCFLEGIIVDISKILSPHQYFKILVDGLMSKPRGQHR